MEKATLSGILPVDSVDKPAPDMKTDAAGMHGDYWILSDEESQRVY